MSNSIIKDVPVQTTEKRIVPGTFVTNHFGAYFTVASAVSKSFVDVAFGIGDVPSKQSVGAPDLRELATLFIQMADVMDGGE